MRFYQTRLMALGFVFVFPSDAKQLQTAFREAMAAPAELPESKGNVIAVQTSLCWDEKLGEVDDRGMAGGDKGARFDREGKHRELRERLAPIHEVMKNLTGSKSEIRAKNDQLKRKIKSMVHTEEEMACLENSKSNAGFHYLGSVKTLVLLETGWREALQNLGRSERYQASPLSIRFAFQSKSALVKMHLPNNCRYLPL